MVPDTPDCDYPYGEELLSNDKIDQLIQSFKDYNIIDYQHQFTDDTKAYFMHNIGEPLRLFTNTDTVTFKDVTGQEITVPPHTAWLESSISDEHVVGEIDDKEIVAYSITVSEKEDADAVMEIYKQLSNNSATKQNINHNKIQTLHNRISKKRTLIKDIDDPVMLTVSVVKFPCVNKAKFCENSLRGDDNMTEQENKNNANQTFIDSVKEAVKEFRNSITEESPAEETTSTNDGVTMEEVEKLLDSKVEEITSTFKAHFGDDGEKNGTPWINANLTPEGEEIPDPEEPEDDEGEGEGTSNKEDVPEEDDVTGTIKEPPADDDDGEGEETEEVPEPSDEEEDPSEEEGEEDTATKSATQGRGNKKILKPNEIEPSAQKSRTNATITGGQKKMTTQRDELSIIHDAIKNKTSTKSIPVEEISYESVGLIPYAGKYLDAIEDPIFLNAYKNSLTYKDDVLFTIDETNTRRAILNTNMFTTYVTKLIQNEPLLEDANYVTGIHGKAHIYGIDDTIGTEDGALPEHFYFDKDVAIQEATITDKEIQTYPQRTKINISDRQRLANVFGDDLVNILLDRTVARLKQGVAAARFYGDTTAANTVDLQYRRQDGYLKEAGQQLTSSDVNVEKITDIFDTMFYSLPEEAQIESEYVFYVPTNVRRAFSAYFLDKAADRAIDFIGQRTPLYWGDIPIKVSPTLNNKPVRDALDDGNVSVLLTKPANTHFVVGREAGIEPKRYAETSSDTYYATIDTANAYSIDDYAVRLSLTDDEYAGLVGADEDIVDDGP